MSSRRLTDDELRELCRDVEASLPEWALAARQERAAFLRKVAQTPASDRASREFQRELWESESLSSTGMGSVKVEPALDDTEFRTWLANASTEPLPEADIARAERIRSIFLRIVRQFENHRKPWLKILRLLAALFPTEFTSLASTNHLHHVAERLLDVVPKGQLAQHREIVNRLNRVLGPVQPGDYLALADRISLPWFVYTRLQSEVEQVTETVDDRGAVKLVPLPAARRRKGLTALSGYFTTMLALLQAVGDGISREDFVDVLRVERPGHKDSSHSTAINALQGEFGVIERDGDLYKLTASGRATLETSDPDMLSEWLLTRVLGFDLGLKHVERHGPIKNVDLKRAIQKANPGWTVLYAPSALVAWMHHLDLLEKHDGKWRLTERGTVWAAQIHWEPEPLIVGPETDVDIEDDDEQPVTEESPALIRKPGFEQIYTRLTSNFPRQLVAELHAGLWAHPRRHFAVLTGLSGAGKTQLALQYGLALAGGDEPARKRVKTIAVAPGWYDPGPLLGYVNPIQPTDYVRTPFLEFLRDAVADPQTPHVVLLDEMNLSRPEQYLAPLLSAMETGNAIELHSEGEVHDGIERRVPYPNNLVIIGTVNMDETTHGLSDKVLDRAFTLEFWRIDIDDYQRWDQTSLDELHAQRLRALLGELMAALEPARLHFGWRVIDDVVDFLARNHEHGGQLEFGEALDAIIYAKIVPKLRGDDSPRFREALSETKRIAGQYQLGRCQAKLEELELDLLTTGSARFWR